MSVLALIPEHTGRTVYTTPEQSPSVLHIDDPFSNPEGLNDIEEKSKDNKEIPPTNDAQIPSQNGTNAPSEQKRPPEVPPRPTDYEISIGSAVKESLQVPPRPPSQPSNRPPKPKPDLPKRAAPSPLRQRTTVPPPSIVEDVFASDEGGNGSLKYTRDPQKLIAYLIPLPKPNLSKNTKNEDALPERFLIYTPPQPHLLKPAKGVKESKKHWCKRKLQEEVQKATKYDGKTFSLRGLHSKTTKGVVWAIRRIKATDIIFLGRIQNKGKQKKPSPVHTHQSAKAEPEVDEIVLVFPSSVTHTIPEIRSEFIAQITRTKKKASKEAAISTILLPVTLAIDTFAAVIWPFGGLFEIDAVWAYASIKGWNTSRIVTKRLAARESIFRKYGGKEPALYLRFQQDEKMEVLRRYLAECCHKKDPKMFDSAGPPPTETQVMKAIGWSPVVRGKTGGERIEGETGWADEEWQMAAFKDDFKATMEKGAASWAKWSSRFEKNPGKALKK